MKSKKLFSSISVLLIILVVSFVAIAETKKDNEFSKTCENSLDKLVSALNKHKYNTIKPLLDEDFVYGGASCGGYCDGNIQVMKMIISDYKYKIEKITVDKIEKEALDYRIFFTYHLENNEKEKHEALMTPEGKFLELTVPKVKIVIGSPEETNASTSTNSKDCCDKEKSTNNKKCCEKEK